MSSIAKIEMPILVLACWFSKTASAYSINNSLVVSNIINGLGRTLIERM